MILSPSCNHIPLCDQAVGSPMCDQDVGSPLCDQTVIIPLRDQAIVQTWGQVHEYLYLSTLKYKFESTCTLLKYFLNYRNVLVLILKYFCQVLEYLKYF